MKHNIHHTSGHFASTLEMIAKKSEIWRPGGRTGILNHLPAAKAEAVFSPGKSDRYIIKDDKGIFPARDGKAQADPFVGIYSVFTGIHLLPGCKRFFLTAKKW